jgi:molybdate transport system regulatory protein
MKPLIRTIICDDAGSPFMGIGVLWLLERVDKFKSLRMAAADMKMSYAKAHRIVKELELACGKPVLLRSRGGAKRGGSELTDEGRAFMAKYSRFEKAVQSSARKIYRTEFAK